MLFLTLILPLLSFATTNSQNMFEKTYARDNSFCTYKGTKIEISIRGGNRYTEPKEMGYGEFIFLRKPNKKPVLMTLNEMRADTLRFFLGTSPFCTKSHGYHIKDSTLAILFQQENRPFKDKLVIQLFDFATLNPLQVIETQYPVDKAQKIEGGFAFRTINEIENHALGKMTIGTDAFIYNQKDFPQWVNYTEKGFEISKDMTFNKFPWKKFFKDQSEFASATGWDETKKTFSKTTAYFAINHKIKKSCLLFTEAKLKPTGTESWICQTM